MKLSTSLDKIKGIGPKTFEALSKAGLNTVEDALGYLPRDYEDYSLAVKIADLQPGKVTVRAKVESVSSRRVRRGMTITTATLADESGKVKAVWFNQPYRSGQLNSDKQFMFSGDFTFQYNQYQITNPSVEQANQVVV
ncbi:ATP-dependent DNA helicase RecG, partial [Candidatus Saccharibacteria bacterium]